jgi:O-antigen/teichoic acid export membrane protein
MANPIKKEGKEFFRIFEIARKEKFVGYTGLAIKNSLYQVITSTTTKLASLVFVIILARMLLPELFGLYSLAIATIGIFTLISDLGTNQALVYFVSKKLSGKNNEARAKGYVTYLLRIKLFLTFIAAIFLAISAKFIADNYYQKPIFLALLAGALYIFFSSGQAFVTSLFRSVNKFKEPFIKELFFQVTRLIIIPLVVLFSIRELAYSQSRITFLIILSLAFVYFLTFILILILSFKNIKLVKAKVHETTPKENRKIKKFLIGLSAITLSTIFFGYIDMIFLGHFVSANFIVFYSASFSIIGSLAIILVFTNVLFPIFSRMKGDRLERAFKKSRKIIFVLIALVFIFVFLFASPIIKIIFGESYLEAVPILRILSLLAISLPLTELYSSYLISKGKVRNVSKLIILSTILNILLNYVLIVWFLRYSEFLATIGAALATVLSRYFYLGGLILLKKKFGERFFNKPRHLKK